MNTTCTSGQLIKLLGLLDQKDSNPERFQLFLSSGLLADLLEADPSTINRDDFRKHIGLPPLVLRFTVDYSLNLEQMIALGEYGWKNDINIIAERFPVNGKGKKKVVGELVKYESAMSSEAVLADLDKNGLRPATHEESLTFGAEFPELQKKFPIVALGSVVQINGVCFVICLGKTGSVRGLFLYSFHRAWHAFYRFLAVRK